MLLTILLFSRTLLADQAFSRGSENQRKVSITSYFGERQDPFTNKQSFHSGVDISGKAGMKVRAIGTGQVVFAGTFGRYGNLVVVHHSKGFTSHYAHLGSIQVQVGEFVRKSEQVGTLGSTGRSTGPHLHFEMRLRGRPFDPLSVL